jgi:hypothetical protein
MNMFVLNIGIIMYPLAVLNIFAEPAFVEAIRVLIISHHPF